MASRIKHIVIIALLFACVMGEVLAGEYYFNVSRKGLSSLFYFVFGIAIALIPLFSRINIKYSFRAVSKYLFLLLFFGGSYLSLPYFTSIIDAGPVLVTTADMLPVIEAMCEKSLSGVSPYTPIKEIWNGWTPKYLPLMWMPFLPAVVLGFDLRWVCIFFLLAALLFVFMRQHRSRFSLWSILALVPLGTMFYHIFNQDDQLFRYTQEGCIIAYYLILGWAIHTNRKSAIILGLVGCLLSRYTLLFWAIMYFIHYLQKNKKEALEIAWKVGVLSLIIMTVSTAIFHLDVFLDKTKNILSMAQDPNSKWKTMDWIDKGLGMARFFEYESLKTLHNLFLFFNLAIPAFCFWLISRFKNYMNVSFFGICSLKLSLVFFFNLIIMPVKYIFYTSNFLSILILFFFLNQIYESGNPSSKEEVNLV